jgi:hypothetical protein
MVICRQLRRKGNSHAAYNSLLDYRHTQATLRHN